MTLNELTKKYYFHDSSIVKICHDNSKKTLTLELNVCNWAQDDYKDGMEENIIISLIFQNASRIDNETELADADIYKCENFTENGKIGLELFVELWRNPKDTGKEKAFRTIRLIADSVQVE